MKFLRDSKLNIDLFLRIYSVLSCKDGSVSTGLDYTSPYNS